MKRALSVLAAVLVVLSLFSGVAAAQETRSGETVVIEEGETVKGDLTAVAGTVVVQGTVDGDLTAFGGDVLVEGEVTGDADAFAGTVRVAGDVGGEVSAAAGTVVVSEDASVGALSTAGGNVAIDGTVAGDVEAAAGSVSLGPDAVVGGDLTYDGALNRHPDATVAGTVREGSPASPVPAPIGEIPTPPPWLGPVYWLLVNLVLGAVLLAAFPRFSDGVSTTARTETLKSVGVGVLALVGVPIALGLVAITLVGIPLSVAGALVFALLLWVGSVYGRFALGAWLLALADAENRWVALALGLVVVAVVGLLPYLGGFVDLLVLLVGLGALSLALYGRYGEAWNDERTTTA
ncbi:polymer-forming cytoskeletal [Halalkalicoccus paucihalophilus]|uniref:Polymer-forming cytoskeletal n=1 Tax=Halalkalicoccus paucihalophilus TaxID=1008153 RepID=A0A151AGZ0_9EURY|nr:polymer-forming cytoskeletal protein [Halalkalicoccus paucihalophilus]KYH26928.1 polymer-forming cytoskeletal [Halalkalicoccus paucihalophilus]